MIRKKIYHFIFSRKGWIPLLFFLIFLFLVIYVPTITTIIVTSFFSAYAVSPVVSFLTQKVKLPRWLSTMIVMFFIYMLILLMTIIVLPVIFKEITLLVKNLPAIFSSLIEWIDETALKLGFDLRKNSKASMDILFEQITTINPIMKPITSIFAVIFKQTFSILSFIMNLLIFSVVFFFVSFRFPTVLSDIKNLFPPLHKEEIMEWLHRFDTILSGFIRGLFTVAFLLGSFYAIGLTIAGLENGGSIGAMIGMFCIVPYVGIFTGFIIAALLAASKGGVLLLIKVVVVFVIIQIIDTIFITPNIMGKRVGISPVFVIIALFAGAELGGFLGVLIAVPSFAIVKLIIEAIVKKYRESDFYQH